MAGPTFDLLLFFAKTNDAQSSDFVHLPFSGSNFGREAGLGSPDPIPRIGQLPPESASRQDSESGKRKLVRIRALSAFDEQAIG